MCLQEEVQQLKQDKEELQQQLQAQKRQASLPSCTWASTSPTRCCSVAAFLFILLPVNVYTLQLPSHMQIASLEAAGHLQNASTEQPNRYSATDILDSLEHTPAQDLLKILQQTMQTLVDYTEELSDIEQPDDNEAVQVQEMLDALRPQLQGTDHAEWMRAISQLHGPLQDLKVEASLIPDLTAEVQTLKEACIFQHQPTLHKLASDVTDLCSSMKIWLSTLDNCSVSYHEKAGQLLQLQARKALCSRAYELMGRT